jgi:hypothetical protein
MRDTRCEIRDAPYPGSRIPNPASRIAHRKHAALAETKLNLAGERELLTTRSPDAALLNVAREIWTE